MKVERVTYRHLWSKADMSNQTVEFTAIVEAGETAEDVFRRLKTQVMEIKEVETPIAELEHKRQRIIEAITECEAADQKLENLLDRIDVNKAKLKALFQNMSGEGTLGSVVSAGKVTRDYLARVLTIMRELEAEQAEGHTNLSIGTEQIVDAAVIRYGMDAYVVREAIHQLNRDGTIYETSTNKWRIL